jgi:hypothetical protein
LVLQFRVGIELFGLIHPVKTKSEPAFLIKFIERAGLFGIRTPAGDSELREIVGHLELRTLEMGTQSTT